MDRERSLRHRNGSEKPDRPFNEPKRAIEVYIDLGKPTDPWSPTFEQMKASLAEPGCLVACAEGTRQYLDWLASQMEAQASVSGNCDLSWNICPSHLWELNMAGYEQPAMLIAEHMIQDWLSKLYRLTTGLKKRPSEQWLGRLRRGLLVWCGPNRLQRYISVPREARTAENGTFGSRCECRRDDLPWQFPGSEPRPRSHPDRF